MRDYESTLKQARTCAKRKYCDIGDNCEYYDAGVCCHGGEKDILNDAAPQSTEGGGEGMSKEHSSLLKEWKKRLGLQDWHIVMKENCRPEDMALSDVEGCTTWVDTTKSACIDMLDPAFYPTNAVGRGADFERCLVHELLHLKLCLVQDVENDLQSRYMHQMIDDLARAFVDAKRAEPPKEELNKNVE